MSSNNQPPFKVICINDNWVKSEMTKNRPAPIKDEVCVVLEIYEKDFYILDGYDSDSCFSSSKFRRLDDLYTSDLTRELAEKALSVGDSVDQPVKQLVNN